LPELDTPQLLVTDTDALGGSFLAQTTLLAQGAETETEQLLFSLESADEGRSLPNF
jgi:hypothetical protein